MIVQHWQIRGINNDLDNLSSAFRGINNDDTVEDWVSRLDQIRGTHTWTNGYPKYVKPLTLNDVIQEVDRWTVQ